MRSEFVRWVDALSETLSTARPGQPVATGEPLSGARWYPASWRRLGETDLFLARDGARQYLVVSGAAATFPGAVIRQGERPVRLAPRDAATCAALRAAFPETAPAKLPPDCPSFGCGDRLGLASPGHLRALRAYAAAPILAQQSVRELTLTGRTYQEVVDAATWAVFQEGYRGGFGADGDHLKSADEVRQLLAAGATFITLDLSLCLGKTEQAPEMPAALRARANSRWSEGRVRLEVSDDDVARFWQVYGAAFPFIAAADALCRAQRGAGSYDLEISVDETPDTTRPVDHLLLALELERRGIAVTSVAPRFPGEFQKGIDYLGNPEALETAVQQHAAIARCFRHKLGIHSGSDKFTAFPIIGRHAGPWLHVKTAGTSWLEAVRVVAATDPGLFREFWAAAGEGFSRARQYYHIRTDRADVSDAAAIPDDRLPLLLDQDAPRQFLHITYGEILRAGAAGGGTLGERLREHLIDNEEAYAERLRAHFQRHAAGLGLTHSG